MPPDTRIRLRHRPECRRVIIRRSEDIYGTSVNIAARLEQFSPPGGIVISDAVHAIVKSRIDVPVEDLGHLELKNLSRPVHAYSLRIPGAEKASPAIRACAGARNCRRSRSCRSE